MNDSPTLHRTQRFDTGRPLDQPAVMRCGEPLAPVRARRPLDHLTSDAAVRASRPATVAAQGKESPPVGAPKTRLLDQDHVSASTQNQALSALLFLYREVFGRDPG